MVVCKQVWAGEDVTIEGHGYSARGVRSVPAAYQQPHPPIWLHGNTNWATDWVVREAQGWMGMIIGDDRTPTLRTTPDPHARRVPRPCRDVQARCEAAGRDPGTLEIVNNGIWRMLDVRDGLSIEQMQDDIGRLKAGGTDWVTFNLCGDDPDVSIETLQWFSDEIIAG